MKTTPHANVELRSTSIDEVPQLLNVLRGEMSLVGPRPHALAHDDHFGNLLSAYAFRHHVKPGITGWAQIKYPYGASTEDSFEKLRYDLYYFKHMNPVIDTIIFLKTIKVIISQFGGR